MTKQILGLELSTLQDLRLQIRRSANLSRCIDERFHLCIPISQLLSKLPQLKKFALHLAHICGRLFEVTSHDKALPLQFVHVDLSYGLFNSSSETKLCADDPLDEEPSLQESERDLQWQQRASNRRVSRILASLCELSLAARAPKRFQVVRFDLLSAFVIQRAWMCFDGFDKPPSVDETDWYLARHKEPYRYFAWDCLQDEVTAIDLPTAGYAPDLPSCAANWDTSGRTVNLDHEMEHWGRRVELQDAVLTECRSFRYSVPN